MKLSDIIRDILAEGKAADKAHQMGLVAAPYGHWRDPKTDLIVAKTVGDQLVKVYHTDDTTKDKSKKKTADKTSDKTSEKKPTVKNPTQGKKDSPEQKALAAAAGKPKKPQKPGEKKEPAEATPVAETLPTYSDNEEVFMARYCNRDFYDFQATQEMGDTFIHGVFTGTHPVNALQALFHVRPDMKVLEGDESWHMRDTQTKFGRSPKGSWSTNNELSLREDIAKTLNKAGDVLTPENIENYVSSWAPLEELDSDEMFYDVLNTLHAVHVVVHEMVHAKCGRESEHFEGDPYDTFIDEGLTERKARSIMQGMFRFGPAGKEQIDTYGAYNKEVERMNWLEDVSPGITSKLWAEKNGKRRTRNVRRVLDTWFDDVIAHSAHSPELTEYARARWMNSNHDIMKTFTKYPLQYVKRIMTNNILSPEKMQDEIDRIMEVNNDR